MSAIRAMYALASAAEREPETEEEEKGRPYSKVRVARWGPEGPRIAKTQTGWASCAWSHAERNAVFGELPLETKRSMAGIRDGVGLMSVRSASRTETTAVSEFVSVSLTEASGQ